MMNKGQAIFIVLMLSLIVIAFLAIEHPFDGSHGESATSAGMMDNTGFPEYDLIPKELKQKMDSLKAAHYNINYSYWYYFDINEVFTFYDLKGAVTVEFTVGNIASSPNIIKGFSSSKESYEAYQADGAFIKALNDLKVWWKPGKIGNSPVRVKMPLTFQVDRQTIKMLNKPTALAEL